MFKDETRLICVIAATEFHADTGFYYFIVDLFEMICLGAWKVNDSEMNFDCVPDQQSVKSNPLAFIVLWIAIKYMQMQT